jgi:exosortase
MAGYPIARTGVVLVIDSYSLLIADACSGLNSMLALSGIGLLYVYLAGHSQRWMNAVLLLSILPIAFIANIIRVLLLVLVTYYEGDAAGRAFHDQAGVLEIALAFGGFFLLDHLMVRLENQHRGAQRRRVTASHAL